MPVRLDRGRTGGAAALALALALPALSVSAQDVWPHPEDTNFADRAIAEGDGMVVIEAPDTVEKTAALVPLTIRVPPQVKQNLKSLTLVMTKIWIP